nr:MAG TPA: hypothetical protein [Caudoviricetes sp.]
MAYCRRCDSACSPPRTLRDNRVGTQAKWLNLMCACFYRGRLPSLVYPYSEIRVISNHPYS